MNIIYLVSKDGMFSKNQDGCLFLEVLLPKI